MFRLIKSKSHEGLHAKIFKFYKVKYWVYFVIRTETRLAEILAISKLIILYDYAISDQRIGE